MSDMKQIFESQVLDEDTKEIIKEAYESALEVARTEIEEQYNTKLKEAEEKDDNEVMKMIDEAVTDELEDISEELKHARTLDVQYADKLEAFKESYKQDQEEANKVMIEETVKEELEELRSDIEEVKKNHFANKLFESFRELYETQFGAEDGVSLQDRLKESTEELDTLRREKKMNELLEGVQGRKRKVAWTILEGTSTDRLEQRFASIKDILLGESVEDGETETVKESENTKTKGEEVEGDVVLEAEEVEEKKNNKNSANDAILRRSLRFIR